MAGPAQHVRRESPLHGTNWERCRLDVDTTYLLNNRADVDPWPHSLKLGAELSSKKMWKRKT